MEAAISEGFQYRDIKFTVITDKEMIGVQRSGLKSKKKKKKNTNAQKIDSFLDLNPGDYVVHENSGIGRYTGIDQITVDGIKKDYMKIVYRDGDNLYVPIDRWTRFRNISEPRLRRSNLVDLVHRNGQRQRLKLEKKSRI